MGPVRNRFESKAEYKFRCARYSLRWFVVFLAAAVLLAPMVYARFLPPPLLIVVGLVMLFVLGMSALAALGAALGGWQAQRTPSALEQRLLRMCALVIAVPFFVGIQAVLCHILWIALIKQEIRLHGRGRSGPLYHLDTEPLQFVLTFGFTALVSLVLPMTIWLVWREKRRAANASLKTTRQ